MTLPAASAVESALRSPGQPLPRDVRQQAEHHFGRDLSAVRIHAGSTAAESAKAVGARAYAVAQDLVFGAGQFEPGSPDGRELLGHELTHVIQSAEHPVADSFAGRVLARAPNPGDAPPSASCPPSHEQQDDFVNNVEMWQWPGNPILSSGKSVKIFFTPGNSRTPNPIPKLFTQWRVDHVEPRGDFTPFWNSDKLDWNQGAKEGQKAQIDADSAGGAYYRVTLTLVDESANCSRIVRTIVRMVRILDVKDRPELRTFSVYKTQFELFEQVINQARADIPVTQDPGHAENMRAMLDYAQTGAQSELLELQKLYESSVFGEQDQATAGRRSPISDPANSDFSQQLKALAPSVRQQLSILDAIVKLEEVYKWSYVTRGMLRRRNQDFADRLQIYINTAWKYFDDIKAGTAPPDMPDRIRVMAATLQSEIQNYGLFLEDLAKAQLGISAVSMFLGIQSLLEIGELALTGLGNFLKGALQAGEGGAEIRVLQTAGVSGGFGGSFNVVVVTGTRTYPIALEEAQILVQSGRLPATIAGSLTVAMSSMKGATGQPPVETPTELQTPEQQPPEQGPSEKGPPEIDESGKTPLDSGTRYTTRTFTRSGVKFRLEGTGKDFSKFNASPPGSQVYIVRNAANKVIYVGQTERDTITRLLEHLAKQPGEWIGSASKIEIAGEGLLERESLSLEQDMIKEYDPPFNSELQPFTRKFGGMPDPADVSRANNVRIIFDVVPGS